MCGFTGFLNFDSKNDDAKSILNDMAESIQHRGPDDSGVWYDSKIGFAHRRLAIQDLSEAGRQPMLSPCGRYVLVFNGEIYNHLDIRQQLKNNYAGWKGGSDSETLLIAITIWGVEITLKKIVGMFSFALWNAETAELTLARDRMGEKPLYWGWAGDSLLFGSELKAIKRHPDFKPRVDREALALYLKYAYVPTPYSIYEGILKLPKGSYITISIESFKLRSATPIIYWDLCEIATNALANPFKGSPEQAVDAIDKQLKESVSGQMLADVPLGAFLSGGVDSSTVVSIMQEVSTRPVKTYTIGFEEQGYNEANHAKAVSDYIGTDHTELYVQARDALDVIPDLPNIYCEPFADSSQIPTFLVSKLAKAELTVALSGDGGDELFGGYNRYLAANKVWKPMQRMPLFARKVLSSTALMASERQWDWVFERAQPMLPKKLKISMMGEKLHKLAGVLALDDGYDFYNSLIACWNNPESLVLGSKKKAGDYSAWRSLDCIEHSMMLADANSYMSDDILVKVDRAAMSASLETRVPILDHRVVELAWRMPIEYKIRNGQGKWLLREVLHRRVPKKLIERPKAGFSLPLDSWLRGPLRDWAEGLLEPERLRSDGYFYVESVRHIWEQHLSGKNNNQHLLWNILMFQAWVDQD